MSTSSPDAPQTQLQAEPDEEVLAFAARVFDLARHGDAQELAGLLKAGLSANLRNHRGDSLLMLAAYNENRAGVQVLLAHGADPDAANDKGQAPLAGVAFKGNAAVMHLLLEGGASPDGPPGTDRTPLMTAAMFDRVNIVEMLLERGADPDRRDGGGLSALDLAKSMGAKRIAPAVERWRQALEGKP